jgi:hypothetical protein
MQARKLITYHFFCLLSFGTHGIASVARLQREEVSRSAKEHEELVHFLQESTRVGILFEFANDLILQITPRICSQSTGMLHLSKFMANLITFY